ncbi:hypothetical protein Sango_0995800 [Sesamum angolense]|uniref:VTT domain-containing protein n=1 Tax=Sesamum angolense TaxID=2727404 RepID=A0AAE1WZZ8_9LAMI|nr:hypothetical protein Sango_0995800 [Sesamum angolense]
MGMAGSRWAATVAVVALAGAVIMRNQLGKQLGWDKGKNSDVMQWLRGMSDRLGFWAIPAYVAVHTVTLALCLPYAVFFEAGASLLFGFLPALLCVFSAKEMITYNFYLNLRFRTYTNSYREFKVIGRLVFRSSGSAAQWVQKNKYFHLLSRGVERDGWKFVLLARFSPVPSYVINYALAATNVGFLVDFLLPTVVGCLPMILQNTSIGSLASAAVASASGSQRSQVWSYVFPLLGISSSILISLRIKKYSTDLASSDDSSNGLIDEPIDAKQPTQRLSNGKRNKGRKKN